MRRRIIKFISLFFITFLVIGYIPSATYAEGNKVVPSSNEVVEVTLASKESGIPSDFKQFFKYI